MKSTTTNIAERKRIGQHFVVGFHGEAPSKDIRTLIQEYFVGSVILMKRNIVDAEQTRSLVQQLQQLAHDAGHDQPLLIGIDQENGLVSAFGRPGAGTQFPGSMALSATGSTELAENVSCAIARELKLVGINWAYSPVADVNSDPRNPVIGMILSALVWRWSFDQSREHCNQADALTDPSQVAAFTVAVARGLTRGGIAACAKHFPGHGDTSVDSHLALPQINKLRSALDSYELPPFKALISGGIPSIMTAHILLPLVADDPASLSKTFTTDILRTELGHSGVVVTDCLEMEAISNQSQGACGVEKGAVRALQAGADIVMICHTMVWQIGALDATYEAAISGQLTLDETRVAALKNEFAGTWDNVLFTDPEFSSKWASVKKASAELSRRSYFLSTALVNGSGFRPLEVGQPVTLFTPPMDSLNKAVDDADDMLRTQDGKVRNTAGPSFLSLAQSIEKRAPCDHIVYGENNRCTVPTGSTAVIFVLRNADRYLWQLDVLDRLAASHPLPFIVLGSCAPYEARLVSHPYIASFEYTPDALEAAIQVVFGEKYPQGTVPVAY
ncbi:unnamed protein product [Mycena citricolor]|uniref:Glycoside hydrolase family 3 N-terminal domain-containing protein n=1 Tax=Mycena citricolor TaxID=2018698 RepID=A0AAD2HFA6_9AGAR|nr:unnamed protein product [Mycena citricolor]